MAPSGANHHPRHFVAISSNTIKMKIRHAAEREEKFILVSVKMNGSEHLNQ